VLQTPGKVAVNGTSELGASIQAGAFAASGTVSFDRHDSNRTEASRFQHRGFTPALDRAARIADRIPALDLGSAYLVRIRWMLRSNSKLPGVRFHLGSCHTGGVRSSGPGRCGSTSVGAALVDSLDYRSPFGAH
jgi:hypothetical protein